MKKIQALLLILVLPAVLAAFTPPAPGSAFVYPSPVQGGDCANLAYTMAESGTPSVRVVVPPSPAVTAAMSPASTAGLDALWPATR